MPEAYEDLARLYYESLGFLVSCNVKIPFDQESQAQRQRQRSLAGAKPTEAALDIDLVAGNRKELIICEVKSWFRSTGLKFENGRIGNAATDRQIRLFQDARFRGYVARVLASRYGYPLAAVRFHLVIGRIAIGGDTLKAHFKRKGWELITADKVAKEIKAKADKGAYVDHPAIAMMRCLEVLDKIRNPNAGPKPERARIRARLR